MRLYTCFVGDDFRTVAIRSGIRISWWRQVKAYAIFLGGLMTRRKYVDGKASKQHQQIVVANVPLIGKASRRRFVDEAHAIVREMHVQMGPDDERIRYRVSLNAATEAIKADPQAETALVCVDMRTKDPFPKGHGCWYGVKGDPTRLVGVRSGRGHSGPKRWQCHDLVQMKIGDAICLCPQGKVLEPGDALFEEWERRRAEKQRKKEQAQLTKQAHMQYGAHRRRNEKAGVQMVPPRPLKPVEMEEAPPAKKLRYVLYFASEHGLMLLPYEEFVEQYASVAPPVRKLRAVS